ncbi:MAG TPA: serine/threonine-protein kinase [Thermoanaerobaculia bacterium]|nr:serine/threonine-protein kinase [Thermoanaerobaculia bacterium]
MSTPSIQVQQRYQIEGEIGSGAMGTVYLAHDAVIDRRVVLKTVRRERIAEDDEERTLVDEARSAGRINHPNVVTVYDVVNDLEADRIYLALEYVEGRTLREVILELGKLHPEEAVDVALQVAAGLAHLHEAGLIHRDIKPSNILIDGKGTVKITDFGIARAAGGSQLEDDGSVFGTPPYMAPEQLLGLEVDARCDIFSLGVVLYEMLTGEKPFGGRTAKEIARRTLGGEVKPISSFAPDVPEPICAVVERAMERDTSSRHPSMAELAEALAQAAGRPEEDAAGKVTSRLLAVRAAIAPDPSATVLIGGRRAKAMVEGLRRWAKEPWAARVRLLVLSALLVLVAGVAGSWWLFERFSPEVAADIGPPGAELVSVHARLIGEGRRLIEAGELDAAGAVLTLAEQFGPDQVSTRRLRLRWEAEAAKQGVEAKADPEPVRGASSPREAVRAAREVLEESGTDPETASVLDQLDQLGGILAFELVPTDVARIDLSLRSERRNGTLTLYARGEQIYQEKFKGMRPRLFGSKGEEMVEAIDLAAGTEELLVYLAVGSAPAELHRLAGPFEGGRRTALDIELDEEGAARVALVPPLAE